MASRIKGITIEINGDTTKLSQALRETDTQLTTVQKNLRDVERLLKLDPTNTELLAQKQRLLAEQSALAADRLAQMEDAANHLDSSLSQSQLDDFNLELDLTRARASLAEQELRDFEQRLNDVGDAADGMDDGFSLADGVISNFVGGAMTKLLDIALQAAEAIWNLDEATEEYRESMALLNTAFETAGFGADTAKQAYEGFYTILGDTGQATEASQLLSQLATNEQDVAEWIDIAAGVYSTFGESIPIESLIEAANETAKTGQVTGTLADALNWVGLSEEEVNSQLSMLNDESLRARLLMDTLSNTYKTASDSFYENSDAILESRQAQLEMDDTLATLGQSVADLKTQLLEAFGPTLQDLVETLSVVFEALGPIIQAIAENIGAKLGPVLEFIGIVAEALKEPLEALGNVAESIINAFSNSMRTAEPIMKLFATAIGIVSGAVSTLLNLLAELINLLADAQAWFLDLLGLGGKGGDIEVTTSGSGSRTMADASTYSIPAFASGGVIPPNNPFLAVLGDNRQEPEVVAPYSTIKQAARDAMAGRGWTGQITIVLRAADGFTRNLSYSLDQESARQGVHLVSTKGV